MSRLSTLIRKEFIQVRREPIMVRLMLVAPIIQLIFFGYAASNDVRNVPVAIYDGDRSAESRRLIEEIGSSPYFHLVPTPDDPRGLERMLLAGRAQMGLSIPRRFSDRLARGETAQVGLYVDGTDANTAGVAASYLRGIVQTRSIRINEEHARSAGMFPAATPRVTAVTRVWFNDELKSVNFMVPGVFGLILLVLTVNLAALTIAKERETGTLEQLMVTPLRPVELLAGKLLPFALMGVLDAALIFLFARGWFHVPFRGSLLLLFAMAPAFLLTTLGLGLLISSLSRTQQEAQVLAFLFIMPSVLLSGFMFPIQNMPPIIQDLTYLIPFRYFLQIVRALFLKGVGVDVLWPQMLALIGWGVVLFSLGVASFRKRL